MADQLPYFTGTDPINYPVHDFIKEVETYMQVKNIASHRKAEVLKSLIRDPCESRIEAAVPAVPHTALDRTDDDTLRATGETRYQEVKTWLTTNYFGAKEQRIIRNALGQLKQGQNESPNMYHARVVKDIRRSGIADADSRNLLIEQHFTNRLLEPIRNHITCQLMTMDQKLVNADLYWDTYFAKNLGTSYQPSERYRTGYQRRIIPERKRDIYYEPVVPIDDPMKQEDDEVAKLTDKLARLEIKLANYEKAEVRPRRTYERREDTRPREEPRVYRRRYEDENQQKNGEIQRDRYFRCGEPGYRASDCRSEKVLTRDQKEAMFGDLRTQRRVYSVEFIEDEDSEEEWWNVSEDEDYYLGEDYEDQGREALYMDDEVFPVQRKERQRETPYQRGESSKKKGKEPEIQILKKPEIVRGKEKIKMPQRQMELDPKNLTIEIKLPEGNETSFQDDMKNKKKRRVTESPVLKKIQETKVELTFLELMKISPQMRQALKKELMGIKMEYEPIEENTVNIIENSMGGYYDDDEEEEKPQEDEERTAAHAYCTIENKPINAIIDTGAGPNVMSENTMHKLGYSISRPSRRRIVTASGQTVAPLGVLENVPITFGGITIPGEFTVIAGGHYQLIIGNSWMKKANAIIDPGKEYMKISALGRKAKITLNFTKEDIRDNDSEEEEEYESVSEDEEVNMIQVESLTRGYNNYHQKKNQYSYSPFKWQHQRNHQEEIRSNIGGLDGNRNQQPQQVNILGQHWERVERINTRTMANRRIFNPEKLDKEEIQNAILL